MQGGNAEEEKETSQVSAYRQGREILVQDNGVDSQESA